MRNGIKAEMANQLADDWIGEARRVAERSTKQRSPDEKVDTQNAGETSMIGAEKGRQR
jgi:hypothetical protein